MAEAPEKSSAGIYLLGILLFGGAIGGVVYATRDTGTPPPPPPTPTATQQPVVNNSPPPPPPPSVEEPVDAGPEDAGDGKTKPTGTGGAVSNGACSKCGEGVSTAALQQGVMGVAGSAQGCYNRALRNSAASGKLTVSVSVGSNGTVCNANVVNDTVGSPEIAQCVAQRFRGRTFPPPERGCVVLNVPINFKLAD